MRDGERDTTSFTAEFRVKRQNANNIENKARTKGVKGGEKRKGPPPSLQGTEQQGKTQQDRKQGKGKGCEGWGKRKGPPPSLQDTVQQEKKPTRAKTKQEQRM